ncbi:lipoyl synthase [Candidatus Woesearchaeota archaeon]|nr:lipoyl synthase [Candidatus Woesearchaeota archaeon]
MQITGKPPWLKVPIPSGENYSSLIRLIRENNIHTICQEARCPNIAECFSKKTATFLILGDTCTRSCRYCNVKTGKPGKLDGKEPKKVANAVKMLGLKYIVLTSPARDDLKDGGARTFIETMKQIKKMDTKIKIELLTPGFREQIRNILKYGPDVFGHNIETVKRLFPEMRPQADYLKSILFLKQIKEFNPSQTTKSGLMVGLGETEEEVIETLKDLKKAKVDIVTIGQYLQPRKDLAGVKKYYTPEDFKRFEEIGERLGFKGVFSAPLVRSSYHAEELIK